MNGDDVVAIGDAKFLAKRVAGLDKGALRGMSDSLRDRLKRGVVVIADPRVVRMSYGAQLLRGLPPARRRKRRSC